MMLLHVFAALAALMYSALEPFGHITFASAMRDLYTSLMWYCTAMTGFIARFFRVGRYLDLYVLDH